MTHFVGWIEGKLEQRHQLLKKGVEGKVIYNKEAKCFDHCICKIEILHRLKREWLGFWYGCFTAIDWKGRQLPPSLQIMWRMEE